MLIAATAALPMVGGLCCAREAWPGQYQRQGGNIRDRVQSDLHRKREERKKEIFKIRRIQTKPQKESKSKGNQQGGLNRRCPPEFGMLSEKRKKKADREERRSAERQREQTRCVRHLFLFIDSIVLFRPLALWGQK